jgi:hypothetical protein
MPALNGGGLASMASFNHALGRQGQDASQLASDSVSEVYWMNVGHLSDIKASLMVYLSKCTSRRP